jgi:1,4-alpha-glucan branching enzyme
VILDVVYNHAGGGFDARSPWFYDLQNNGNANHSLYFTDVDWAGGQVFAYRNPWVCRFLIDNATALIEEYRIDGLRYDEVRVIVNNGGETFCRNLTDAIRLAKQQAVQIAEYWNDDRPRAVEPTPAGLGFDAELGDGLRDALRGLLGQLRGGASAMVSLANVAANLVVPATFAAGGRLDQCLENHDLVYAGHAGAARVARLADNFDARSWYARSRSRIATGLLLTAPGIPMLFMGQELLEEKPWSDTPHLDTTIWWSQLDSGDQVAADFVRFTSELIALRRGHPALTSDGCAIVHVHDGNRVLAFHRSDGAGDEVMVVCSLHETPWDDYAIGFPASGPWRLVFDSEIYDGDAAASAGDVIADGPAMHGQPASARITIPANGLLVFAKQ